MSDPRTDFFTSTPDSASAGVSTQDSSDDPRTTFFASAPDSDTPAPAAKEPVYDAAEFKRRVGRDPEPAELANFKQFKGEGWSTGNGGGSFAGLGEAALATGANALKGINHAVNDIMPGGDSKAAIESEINTDPILNYRGGPEAQPYLEGLSTLMTPVTWTANKIHQGISSVAGPRAADIAGDVATLLPGARGIDIRGIGRKIVNSMHDPESATTASSLDSPRSLGAAEAPPNLEGTSPELQTAVANAKNLNREALERQRNAETLPQPDGTGPLRLRAGQATRDDQQISDEKNLRADPDTQGILSDSIDDQNEKLGSSMGEIRRRATPDIVQRSNAEHGQAAIDAIKTQDNASVLDVRSKYKALADANGGNLPMDTSTVLGGIRSQLSDGFLTKTARENPDISEILEQLESGRPMSFEQFENARTNLADVQRGKGSAARAAAIVRNQLENMPLSGDAAKLKGLADTARAAARSRFETIEQNPAYEAAINDNVPKTQNGLHAIGAPSPLADSFMDRYFLGNSQNASRAYIGRTQGVMANNPDFSSAVEAASLNRLRDAAGLDIYNNGNFRHAGYRNARAALDNKADVLMSPQSADFTSQLQQASDDVGYEGKSSSVNRSNTALTLQRFGAQYPDTPGIAGTLADYGTDIAAAHAGPVGYAVKKIGSAMVKNARDRRAIEATKAAKLKFAQSATAPGAGIEMPASSQITRATGGKVDHEALVNRLMARWEAAKKATRETTQPFLRQPDTAIVKALEIAQEHI